MNKKKTKPNNPHLNKWAKTKHQFTALQQVSHNSSSFLFPSVHQLECFQSAVYDGTYAMIQKR